jgi:CelD/BcsL family acetyltransferase involved in cellulose biosynthesis
MSEIRIRKTRKLDKNILANWQTLWESSSYASIYNSPGWFLSWLEVFPDKEYELILGFEGRDLKVAVALVREKKYGIKVWTPPGGRHLDRFTLLMADDAKGLKGSLIERILSENNIYIPELEEEFVQDYLISNNCTLLEASKCPYIRLENDPFNEVSKKQKSKIRNRYKKYRDNLTLVRYGGDSRHAFEKIVRLDEKSAKSKKGINVFHDKGTLLFYKSLCANMGNNISLDILYYKQTPVVFSIGFVLEDTYIAIQTSYREEFSYLIPGKMLLFLLLKELKRKGFKVFDFSRGENTFKKEFTSMKSSQYDLFYSHSLLIRVWWRGSDILVKTLKGKKWFYENYLNFSVGFTYFKERLVTYI